MNISSEKKHHESCHEGPHHHEMMIQDFKKRFWICFFLTVPILVLTPSVQSIGHYSLKFLGDKYILFSLSSFVFIFGGWPFLTGMLKEIREKNPGMMTLVGLAITVAYLYSSLVVFFIKGEVFFAELATLIDIMLLGHWIEMKSVLGASRSLEMLIKMIPSKAHLVKDGYVTDIKTELLQIDDVVLIKPAEQLPSDGVIVDGISYVDESMISGESKPVRKEKGMKVVAGSINGSGSIKVMVTHLGKDSYLSKVVNLVRGAQSTKSKTQRLADKAAKWLTFIAVFSGLLVFFSWNMVKHDMGFSLERMVTVMVISCPHALGLAIPLVVAVSTTLCAKSGLLIRNRTAFENARKITTVVFDKTGTLTRGKFGVIKFRSVSKRYSDEEILQLAGAVEQSSGHPIANGIVQKVKENELYLAEVKDFQNIVGEGVQAKVGNVFVQVVGINYLKKRGISFADLVLDESETVVFVLIKEKLEGYISLSDEIRKESFETISKLKKKNIKSIMITGDNESVARKVSEELKIDHYYASTLPHEKLNIVKELQQKGEFVAMTGDGVNDAPALAQADIGIAIGSGTDVAAETADIILVESNPLDILALILFGKATYRKMVQNLIWATAYNAIAIPLAGGVLYKSGIVISPSFGAVLMTLSTIVVALNSQLLKVNKGLKFLRKTKKGVKL